MRRKEFVCSRCVGEFSANAAHAAQYKGRMVAYMIYYIKFYLMLCHSPFIYKTSFRPAPTAWTSQARPCLRCWSQLAGGKPPGPPGTHASSQFWYSSSIPVLVHNSHLSSGVLSSESSILYLDLHLYHSTRFAWPCLARGKPLVPPVHIFYSCSGPHV